MEIARGTESELKSLDERQKQLDRIQEELRRKRDEIAHKAAANAKQPQPKSQSKSPLNNQIEATEIASKTAARVHSRTKVRRFNSKFDDENVIHSCHKIIAYWISFHFRDNVF